MGTAEGAERKRQLKNKHCSAINKINLKFNASFSCLCFRKHFGKGIDLNDWNFFEKLYKASFPASPSAKEMSDQREKLQQIMEATGLWYCSVSNKSTVH